MDEIQDVLEGISDDLQAFKQRHTQALDELTERMDELEAGHDRLGPSGTSKTNERKQRDAFKAFLRSRGESKAAPDDWLGASSPGYQEKAMSIGSDTAGGHAVPEFLENRITRRLAELSPIRRIARVVMPNTAFSSYKIPVSLGETSSGWVAETTARTDTTTPTLNVPAFADGEIYAMPKASQWALDDWGAGSLEEFLAEEVAEQFAVQEGSAFVTGNGTNKPTGFLNATPVSTADDASPRRAFRTLQYVALQSGISPVAAAIAPDDLIELLHTLKAGYWSRANWVMSRATVGTVRKLKDTQNNYLWTDSLASGTPPTLLGFPVTVVDAIPTVAIDAHPLAFGDFRAGYTVLEKLTRLLVDPYTDKPNVRFYWTKRVSGATVDDHAIKVGKVAAS